MLRPDVSLSATQSQTAHPSTHKVGTMVRHRLLRQGSAIGKSFFDQLSGCR
jgi:hypothetical protein